MHSLDYVSTGVEYATNILCVNSTRKVWVTEMSTVVRFVAHPLWMEGEGGGGERGGKGGGEGEHDRKGVEYRTEN